MILKLVFLFLTSYAGETRTEKALIEIKLSTPEQSESYSIVTRAGREYMSLSSNRLSPKRLEIGTYTRGASDLERKLKLMVKTIRKSKLDVSPHAWRVSILGKDVPLDDPRHAQIMDMFYEISVRAEWLAVDIVQLRPEAPYVNVTRKNLSGTKSEKVPFVNLCKSSYEKRMICEFEKGFIFFN